MEYSTATAVRDARRWVTLCNPAAAGGGRCATLTPAAPEAYPAGPATVGTRRGQALHVRRHLLLLLLRVLLLRVLLLRWRLDGALLDDDVLVGALMGAA